MKKNHFFFILLFLPFALFAQKDSANAIAEKAKGFFSAGEYEKASHQYAIAIELDKDNIILKRNYALSLYLKRDYTNALKVIKDNIDAKETDESFFQMGGNIYKALEEKRDAERLYQTGIKKFPSSGLLYNEYGELLQYLKKNDEAIEKWEKGIEVEPSYAYNYFNASQYYFEKNKLVPCILYGEIFVNMESLSEKASVMKATLLKAYKEKIMLATGLKASDDKNEFSKLILNTFIKQKPETLNQFSIESLTMLRTKFVLEWFEKNSGKYPYKLFDHQLQLLREGMFDAYNQWLFGPALNLPEYDEWIKKNQEAFEMLQKFQLNRVFKMPVNQNYLQVNISS